MHRGGSQEFHYDLNPYDSFMRNHLKHYGYYTGKNESYRSSIGNRSYESWDQTQGFQLSDPGSDTDYENQALEDEKDADNQFSQDQKRTTQLSFSYHAGKMVPKLKEPRSLYALSKEPGPQQAPRWPADMEVLPDEEQPKHIDTVPSNPELFSEQTGYEQMPQPVAEGEGRVVYYCPPSAESYFLRSRVGGSRAGCPNRAVKLRSEDDTTLLFESRFESGNLMKAIQVSEFEYELQLRYDLYTDKHTQWFYFRVLNARKGHKYRFTITNFLKPGSLYNNGMRPLLYSEHASMTKKQGWRRCGEDIKYFKNYVRRTDVKGDKSMYSLTWTVSFPYDNDTYYFAHCYPYTYTDLQQYLLNLSNDPMRSKFCKQRILCRSLAGNMVYILTITSPAQTPQVARMKRAVVVTARVHPGETNASWMMKGFLDYLTSNSPDAKVLRDHFVFKIVPMLNPDGVIVGNYRCSLAGRDLNRNYKSVLKDSFPSVSHTKTMIKRLLEEREVIAYCDLHGHSRKQNVFIYGCDNKKNPSRRLKERIFPVIMGRNASDKFNFDHCKFKVQKSKEGTGRVVMWQMGIMNSYTMEATFCGSTLGSRKKTHFTTKDFEAMGYHFCDSLLDYCDPNETKCNNIMDELLEKLRQDILRHLERSGTPLPDNGEIDLSEDFGSDVESSTTGSDSSADDGLPVHLLALAPKLTKKKKLRSRKERDKKRNSAEKPKEKEKEPEKEKPSSGRMSGQTRGDSEGDKKPGSSKKDKMRYRHGDRSTLHSAGRERQHSCHSRTDGMPIFAQERCEDRTLRKRRNKQFKEKSEYLEALTNAYLMSGVLKSSSQDVPSFRYSAGNVGLSASGVPMTQVDGLCPHHEKALAEQFVANQLAGLQFEDDKFDWSHHAMDTAKAVEALSQRDASSPQRHHEFNNHMVTMSSLHQSQKPLSDYIRNSTGTITNRPQTGRRSVKTPIKSHPSPFDELNNEELNKGVSSTTINLKTRCPSATNFTVFDSQDKNNIRTPSRKERPTSSKTSRSGMERPKSSSHHLKRVSSTNTSNSSPSDIGIDGRSFNAKGQGQKLLIRSNSVASCGRTSTQPVANHDIDAIKDDDTNSSSSQPTNKVHRCSTEATPITDLTTYTNHHRTESSSHHFNKAQNFYPSPAQLTNQERAKAASSATSSIRSRVSKLRKNSSDDAVTNFRASFSDLDKIGPSDPITNVNMNNSADIAVQNKHEAKVSDKNASETRAAAMHDGNRTNETDDTVSESQTEQDTCDSEPSMHQADNIGNHSNPDMKTNETGINNKVVEPNVNKKDNVEMKTKTKQVFENRNEIDSNNNRLLNGKVEKKVQNGHNVKDDSKAMQDTSEGDTNEDEINDNVRQDDDIDINYKSHFKLSLESELFQQQVTKSPRSQRSDLNLSGNPFRQYTDNLRLSKKIEIPQTEQQYTREFSSLGNYMRSGSVNSSIAQAVLRQRQVEMSPRSVDNMQKYRPGENPPGTIYPRAPSQNTNSSMISAQFSPRQNSSRLSKVMLTPREYDITENLYPERIISPQSTQRYIQVSRLPLQTKARSGGDVDPSGYPSPPGSPGCDGPPNYRILRSDKMDSYVSGQSFGDSYVSPARKRLESHRPMSGRHSAKGERSPIPVERNPSHDVQVVEFHGGFKTRTGYMKNNSKKKK